MAVNDTLSAAEPAIEMLQLCFDNNLFVFKQASEKPLLGEIVNSPQTKTTTAVLQPFCKIPPLNSSGARLLDVEISAHFPVGAHVVYACKPGHHIQGKRRKILTA